MKIGIIDYGMGNLRSVQKAFEFIGFDADIINKSSQIKKYDKIVLPGVGAFEDAIKTIKTNGFDEGIADFISKNKPFLGICLGMQLLFDTSFENGKFEGLKLFKGEIKRLPEGLKIPHMGWNSLDISANSRLYKNLDKNPFVYFIHSYYLQTDENIVNATTFYGENIQVSIENKNVFAVQFHPEKSGETGLQILRNFCNIEK